MGCLLFHNFTLIYLTTYADSKFTYHCDLLALLRFLARVNVHVGIKL